MIKAILIDDEPHCLNRLTVLLKTNHSHAIHIAGSYQTVEAGADAIEKLQPHLVFLDVELQHDKTCFDLLRKLSQINFDIIFTTAYQKYAIQAIKFSAIDYLLKPVDAIELEKAIDRFEQQKTKENQATKIDVLLNNFSNQSSEAKRICVPVASGLVVLKISDIIRCQSNVNYTTFFLNDKQKLVVAKTLKKFEDLLKEDGFFRVHQSHLVNLACIKSYHRGGFVTLLDGSTIEVSTRRKDDFLKKLTER